MKVTYYGHSCFSIDVSNKTLLFDPFISENPLAGDIDLKKIKADYICISTRGGSGLKKLLGTTTSTLIEKSTTPVLVVPKTYRIKPIKEIWYSSDLANLKNELVKDIHTGALKESEIIKFVEKYK